MYIKTIGLFHIYKKMPKLLVNEQYEWHSLQKI